jgi:hypothetical protein
VGVLSLPPYIRVVSIVWSQTTLDNSSFDFATIRVLIFLGFPFPLISRFITH